MRDVCSIFSFFMYFSRWKRCAATSKATVYKEGIGKYIAIAADPAPADSKIKSGGGEGGEPVAGLAHGGKDKAAGSKDKAEAAAAATAPDDQDDDMWANAVPVKKVKVQPKAGFGDFSSW